MYKIIFSILLIALQVQYVQSSEIGLVKLMSIYKDNVSISIDIYEMKICNKYGVCRNLLQTKEGKAIYFYQGNVSMADDSYINIDLLNQSHLNLEPDIFSSLAKGMYVLKKTFSGGVDGTIEGCKSVGIILGILGGFLTVNPLSSAALGYFEGSLIWGTIQGGATMAALGAFLPGIFGAVQGLVAGCLLGAAGGALISGTTEFMDALDDDILPDSKWTTLFLLDNLVNKRFTSLTPNVQISLNLLVDKLGLAYKEAPE